MFDQVDPTAIDTHRRTGAPGSTSFAAPPYGGRARGDLAGPDGGRLVPGDRRASGQSAFDDLARSRRQWLERTIPGLEGGATAAGKARRPKVAKLARSPRLRRKVERLLVERWSPQQIAHRLRLDHPSDPEMRVSHETIYQSLYVQTRGALRKELTACLRTGWTRRRSPRHGPGEGRLKDMVSISERPAEAADRAVPGHWEGDLILGKLGRSAIGVLVERRSRYMFLLHLPGGRTAPHVRRALVERMVTLPDQLRRSLTWDQGKEMAQHARFSIESGVSVYFCDPRSPWQRGTSENTNGLLRQYFPKGTDLSAHSQPDLDAVARQLNGRPRQTLDWLKPCEIFTKTVALTA